MRQWEDGGRESARADNGRVVRETTYFGAFTASAAVGVNEKMTNVFSTNTD